MNLKMQKLQSCTTSTIVNNVKKIFFELLTELMRTLQAHNAKATIMRMHNLYLRIETITVCQVKTFYFLNKGCHQLILDAL